MPWRRILRDLLACRDGFEGNFSFLSVERGAARPASCRSGHHEHFNMACVRGQGVVPPAGGMYAFGACIWSVGPEHGAMPRELAMSGISMIRKAAAAGLLASGTLGVAAPAVGGVTVLDTRGLLTIASPPNSFPAEQSGDFAASPRTASGAWGSFTVSASAAGFSASASTNNVFPASETTFDWSLAYLFSTSTATQVTINYQRFAGTVGNSVISLLALDASGDPIGAPLWALPQQESGSWSVVIPASTGSGSYVIGYQEVWETSSFSPMEGGLSVTLTEVPAPGAMSLLAALGLIGPRRRR
jgi:hypothetical protein